MKAWMKEWLWAQGWIQENGDGPASTVWLIIHGGLDRMQNDT